MFSLFFRGYYDVALNFRKNQMHNTQVRFQRVQGYIFDIHRAFHFDGMDQNFRGGRGSRRVQYQAMLNKIGYILLHVQQSVSDRCPQYAIQIFHCAFSRTNSCKALFVPHRYGEVLLGLGRNERVLNWSCQNFCKDIVYS